MTGGSAAKVWAGLSRRAKVATAIAGAVSAVLAAGAGVASAWSTLGFPAIASKEHVAGELRKVETRFEQTFGGLRGVIAETRARTAETQIEVFELQRGTIEKELFDIEVGLSGVAVDDRVRGLLTLRRRQLDDDKRRVDMRLDELRRSRLGASAEAAPPK